MNRSRRMWTVGVAAAVAVAGCRTVEPPSPTAPRRGEVAGVNRVSPTGEGAVARSNPSPGSGEGRLQQAQHLVPTEPPAESPIDLGVALRLAGADNPTVNLAREAVLEAEADQQAARALLLPSVNVGGNFHLHRGNLQGSTGLIRNVDSQSLYVGGGARTLAAETVAFPGLRLFAHLGDAVYEPLAARQVTAARRADAQATQNAILLDVTAAYLELVGAEERVRLLKQGEENLGEVVKQTAANAKAGQGLDADANRAEVNAALLRRDRLAAEEERLVASARLGQLLALDPAVVLRTPGGSVAPLRVFADAGEVSPLIDTALASRPEMAARTAGVLAAQVRRRQEATRPWLPTVSVGFSGGAFGGGSNQVASDFSSLQGRTDFDVLAVWSMEGLGFGNRARKRAAGAVVGQTVADLEATRADIRRQVSEAHTDVRAAARQIETTSAAVAVAEEGYRLEMERIRQQPAGRPIETLDSVRQLLDARLELVRAVVEYNAAQFRLLAAVGGTPDAPTTR